MSATCGRSLSLVSRFVPGKTKGGLLPSRPGTTPKPVPRGAIAQIPKIPLDLKGTAGTNSKAGDRTLKFKIGGFGRKQHCTASRKRSVNPRCEVCAKQRESCAKCHFNKFKLRWQSSVGSVADPWRKGAKIVWLIEKPTRWRTCVWGIGCLFCSQLLARQSVEKSAVAATDLKKLRLNTKWARCSVHTLSNMQSSSIRKHSLSTIHKTAHFAYLSPGKPLRLAAPASKEDSDLLAGAVPQPPDLLRVFRAIQSPISFKSMETFAFTEDFISSTRQDARIVSERAAAKIVRLFQEVVRQKKREVLAEATSMSISMDDKSSHRVIRYKTNLAHLPYGKGVLCVLQHGGIGGDLRVQDFDPDFSERLCHSLLRGMERMATPLGQQMDLNLYQHMIQICRTYTADGCPAALKAGRILASSCPNLTSIIRGPSHALRREMRKTNQNDNLQE
jgi:hypothetical protein